MAVKMCFLEEGALGLEGAGFGQESSPGGRSCLRKGTEGRSSSVWPELKSGGGGRGEGGQLSFRLQRGSPSFHALLFRDVKRFDYLQLLHTGAGFLHLFFQMEGGQTPVHETKSIWAPTGLSPSFISSRR